MTNMESHVGLIPNSNPVRCRGVTIGNLDSGSADLSGTILNGETEAAVVIADGKISVASVNVVPLRCNSFAIASLDDLGFLGIAAVGNSQAKIAVLVDDVVGV